LATGLDRLVPQKLGDGSTPRTQGASLLHEACVEALSDSAFPVWSVKAKALLLYLIKTDEDGARDWARSSSAEVEEALRAKYPELYKAVAEELQSRTVPAGEPEKET